MTVALEEFPLQSEDKIRFADTDRQGHVNNSVFCQYLETARVEFIYSHSSPLIKPEAEFVIVNLCLDFKSEIFWPGNIQIGTKVSAVGNSSFKLEQAIFQNNLCVATAKSVIVCIDKVTRRPSSLSRDVVSSLSQFIVE